MRKTIIVAMAENQVIGKDNDLPWRLSGDLKRFKAITMGKPIIMGRKTYDSIGRPLPGRTNIVITRNRDWQADGCKVVSSLDEAFQVAEAEGADEAMIIGGAEIYRQALAQVDRLELTLVKAEIEGDAFFPEYNQDDWKVVSSEKGDDENQGNPAYDFVTLDRL